MRSEINTQSSYIQYDLFKEKILGRIMLISVIFTLFFAILKTLNINDIGEVQEINNYIHAAFVLPAYFLFKRKALTLEFCSYFFSFFCFLTSITALLYAENDGFRAIWLFLSTMIAFIFSGRAFGLFFGITSLICVCVAGFVLESNLNTESVLSTLISLLVLILVMSAYTGQIEKHLNHIDQIQQELYYLANKSAISTSLNTDEKTQKAELSLKHAQQSQDHFSLVYVDIDNTHAIEGAYGNDVIVTLKKELLSRLKAILSPSDIFSTIHNTVMYIVLPHRDSANIDKLLSKIQLQICEDAFSIGGYRINVTLSISVTKLYPEDTSMRSLHIRADKGLTKAKAMGGNQTVFVNK